MLVINLFGVPGSGKTCNAHYLCFALSVLGYKVEYIPENARFATYQHNKVYLKDQLKILGDQNHYLVTYAQDKHVDFVISDSPLINSLIYVDLDNYYALFEKTVLEVAASHNNLNFLLKKSTDLPHSQSGRYHSQDEALQLEPKLEQVLNRNAIPHEVFYTSPGVEKELLESVLSYHNSRTTPKI